MFAHRSRHRTPISGSIKYRVLTRAKGRCECCGAHESQRALEVDHIVPRNQGGTGDLSNLQALCFRCNAGKRDTDRTDFRGLQASYARREAGCVFCALEGSGRVLLENELAMCIADAHPVTPGHSLVIPRRHVAEGLALHQPEWNAVAVLLKQLRAQDARISGWNEGRNSGEAAGQTVFQAHWHLIPRRQGDCEQLRCGVRGVIAGGKGLLRQFVRAGLIEYSTGQIGFRDFWDRDILLGLDNMRIHTRKIRSDRIFKRSGGKNEGALLHWPYIWNRFCAKWNTVCRLS
ncbi:HNH endonuclease [Synechococcus sp. J7-Johnson]|uniref:HIT domain-containing protein n=1 Tax=Synechococcus sp. J7-Johnson TaxID=2823737 RepID=UPI0020CDBE2F|nr:HIT domain-containing protein [Synechococcus sp. J7-Johnson]MCP9840717.1 HNH endonuclease [Synechococcus sp. J7-Johnson]